MYLYNFLLFVDWPKSAASDTIKLAVYGAPRIYEALRSMSGKTIKGKSLVVFSLTKPEGLDNACQVLFVGDTGPQVVRELLNKVAGKPVLTVSDKAGFIGLGGMVSINGGDGLGEAGKKQKRFTINLFTVLEAHMKIRSRLLRISEVIYGLGPAEIEMPQKDIKSP